MKETLVIIGSHPRTREKFDFDRTDCDIWMFNEAISGQHNEWAKRADAIFQMHAPAIWRNPQNRNDPGHAEWLRTQTAVTVWMQEQYEDVPMCKKYPIDEILEMIGGDPNHFLSSSVPQAMALGAYLGTYKRIEVYGVAMETNTEYQFQREGVAYWYGFLKGRGVDFYFADDTFKALLYGYEGDAVLPYEIFGQRIEELRHEIERLDAEYVAASRMCLRIVSDFIDRDNTKEITDSIQKILDISLALGVIGGRSQENEKYKGKADAMREASGGEFIFSRQEFESSAKNLTDRAKQMETQVNMLSGQADLIHASIQNAAKNSPKRRKLLEAYKQLLGKYLQAHNQAMIFTGAAQENFLYMARLDKMIRAAGGEKSEAVLLEAKKESNHAMVAE